MTWEAADLLVPTPTSDERADAVRTVQRYAHDPADFAHLLAVLDLEDS
ncbi:MAG: hypothetical protein JWO69_2020 [Thermoleophilia bacterium]|nr:hypothetical protein [Thermoleophilia bacterium]